MAHPKGRILSVAAALSAITGGSALSIGTARADTVPLTDETNGPARDLGNSTSANHIIKAGGDLLGFVVTRASDGSIITAAHDSHVSHSSHASHASHQSGF